MIKHYDLFAGIGGFSLALDTIFNEYERKHIFCEWEAFPTAVLKKHWPDATYYGDIADLVADTDSERREGERGEDERRLRQSGGEISDEEQSLVILTGGFPCQPFSHAGRRQGTADNRYLWPEMFAVIQNVRPDWVIAENVRGLVTWMRAWFSKQCALTWKAKVTKSNRLLYQLSPSVRRIGETGSGLLQTCEAKNQEGYQVANGKKYERLGTEIGTKTGVKLRLQPAMTKWMMGYPEGWTELPLVHQDTVKSA